MLSSVIKARPAKTQANGRATLLRKSALLLWTVLFAGAFLRLVALGHKSFWLDEIASVTIARRPSPVFWHFLWHDEGNMALYYVLLKPWLHLGYGEATVRLLSVVPGVLSLPLMYVLGKRLFGREAGVLATALLAVNACAIAVSQEARAYSFVVLAVLLSTYLFVRCMEGPSYRGAIAYALVAGVTCYFHYFGVLVPVAHGISFLAVPPKRRSWKPLLLAWGIVALMASPILWLMHAQDVGHISWLQPPSWLELYHLGVFLAADGGKAVGAVLLALELVLVGFFLASFNFVWRSGSSERQVMPDGNVDELLRWRYTLVASMVATPVVITLLVSSVRPAFYHRFLIICLPGWLSMVAVGALNIPRRSWRTAMLVFVIALSLVTTAIMYRRVTEDWRGAVRYLIVNTRSDDRVLYYQSVGEFAGESYRDWLQPANLPRPAATGINLGNSGWQLAIDHPRRIWLVLYRAKADDTGAREIERELANEYVNAGEKKFAGVRVIEYRAK